MAFPTTRRKSTERTQTSNIGTTAAALQDHLIKSLNINLDNGLAKKPTKPTLVNRKTKQNVGNDKKKTKKEKKEEYVIPQNVGEVRTSSLAERMGIIPAPDPVVNRLSEPEWHALKRRCRDRGEMGQPCSICKELYTFGREQVLLSCSHIFHRKCVGSFEKFSGSRTCPMCRCRDYEKRVVYEGAEITAHRCATTVQSTWRRYVARKKYLDLRETVPPKDERLRKEFYRNKLVNICEQVSRSYAEHEQNVSKLMSSIDQNIASNRFVMREFNDMHTTNKNLDWEAVEDSAKRREFSDCPICLSVLQRSSSGRGGGVALLSCSHVFHVQCLTSYERFADTPDPQCPVCRSVYARQTLSEMKSDFLKSDKIFS